MAMQHDKQFKLDAVQYYQDHKDLGVRGCAENLGIGYSTLTKWLKDFRESGDMVFACVIWSFDDMGLGKQVILSDKVNRETKQNINIGKVIIFLK